MNEFPAIAMFVIGFVVFFLVIALTVILGAVSRRGDKRAVTEGRVSPEQRPPTELERDAYSH